MITPLILSVLIIWLLILSFFLYKIRSHYYQLVSRTKKRRIDDILDSLIEKNELFNKEIEEIKRKLEEVIYQQNFYYQKIGFLRFNPFDRVGGEQSFILALLNKENTGIVLNFLYTREGIRVYAKRVKKGLSEEYELSNEEKEAIKKAK